MAHPTGSRSAPQVVHDKARRLEIGIGGAVRTAICRGEQPGDRDADRINRKTTVAFSVREQNAGQHGLAELDRQPDRMQRVSLDREQLLGAGQGDW